MSRLNLDTFKNPEVAVSQDPALSLARGGAQAGSNGFFDVNNVPPWDIWLDFSQGILVSGVADVLAVPGRLLVRTTGLC